LSAHPAMLDDMGMQPDGRWSWRRELRASAWRAAACRYGPRRAWTLRDSDLFMEPLPEREVALHLGDRDRLHELFESNSNHSQPALVGPLDWPDIRRECAEAKGRRIWKPFSNAREDSNHASAGPADLQARLRDDAAQLPVQKRGPRSVRLLQVNARQRAAGVRSHRGVSLSTR